MEPTKVDPKSPNLGLSAELAADLKVSTREYCSIFDGDDPASAAFSSAEAERAFYERGWELARRVRREVDEGWDVTYVNGLLPGEAESSCRSPVLEPEPSGVKETAQYGRSVHDPSIMFAAGN
ncbi:hypothetical protein [Amycolatopsis sp. FDAARGOS 1241]|uniref:hypothetical protein n=1 Tax=Amycolatopsis sp. FDAARGOS 1241 TaxID=2778070 RepID=UPI001952054D|nr:hypothetical protein [Amycolatopsis sp. FDAARGOS 1241]QRP47867.1 hypothetical protein I6J71_08125 [Amycolatopsis sp. FDAARGOS 1241]